MLHTFSALLFFLLAVTLDSLSAGLTYGTRKVHVRFLSFCILVFVPALFITASRQIGAILSHLFPPQLIPVISFVILSLLGISKLFESLIRHIAHKSPNFARNWGCKIKQLNIIFTVYLSPEDANQDDLQILSAGEALTLSLALSLDSILTGMAFTGADIPLLWLFLLAAACNLLFFLLGYLLGRFLCHLLQVDLSWLSGLFLLLLALHILL